MSAVAQARAVALPKIDEDGFKSDEEWAIGRKACADDAHSELNVGPHLTFGEGNCL